MNCSYVYRSHDESVILPEGVAPSRPRRQPDTVSWARAGRLVMPCLAYREELCSPAVAYAQPLNLLDGIIDLHLENMLAEEGSGLGRVTDVTLTVACLSRSHPVESQH